MTTNPTIFQKALSQGDAYDEQIRDLALRGCDVGDAHEVGGHATHHRE